MSEFEGLTYFGLASIDENGFVTCQLKKSVVGRIAKTRGKKWKFSRVGERPVGADAKRRIAVWLKELARGDL